MAAELQHHGGSNILSMHRNVHMSMHRNMHMSMTINVSVTVPGCVNAHVHEDMDLSVMNVVDVLCR